MNDAQKADKTRLVRRLCFIKNVFLGDTDKMAARRVGVSQPTGGRWLKAWNEGGVDGLLVWMLKTETRFEKGTNRMI
ncbi:helix-turn-helix domain-containing protein [Halostagnicola sp. A-GB9-2]|nr:helix-turn-helix domain-containing protein [Halostagnicola sp. A-GB9-2]MDJ1434609.1 helix-turn-helix domain-containing protein [Halostagnicola sp. A-GB9-2]